MVDFIKVVIQRCDLAFLENHPDLKFVGRYYCDTGESLPKKTAMFRGLKFILFDSGLLKIQGSIHKYKNHGKHNYDDFTYSQIVEVLNDVSTRFGFQLSNGILRNLEVGMNLPVQHDTTSILNQLLLHKNEAFKDISIKEGHIKQAQHSQYILKVYDKGRQYNLDYHCLRIELKFTRMQKLRKIGLNSLLDLLNISIYDALLEMLISEWKSVLLYESPLPGSNFKKLMIQKKLPQWQNPYYWQDLTKQERYRQRKQFKRYVFMHTAHLHYEIEKMISRKFESLI